MMVIALRMRWRFANSWDISLIVYRYFLPNLMIPQQTPLLSSCIELTNLISSRMTKQECKKCVFAQVEYFAS